MQTIFKFLDLFFKLCFITCAKGYYLIRFFFYDRFIFHTKIHLTKKQLGKTKFLTIIASYSKNGQVSENILKAISILKELNIQVVFISNTALLDSSVSLLGKTCEIIIEQPNIGRDFGAFKTGVEYLRQKFLSDTDKILFMNDSTLIFPDHFRSMIKKIISTEWNFIGATENYEIAFHVSSYFFGVSKKIFQSDWFGHFWKSYRRISYRRHAIKSGEIKLSKLMIDKGYFPLVLFSSVDISEKVLEEYRKQFISNNRNISNMTDIILSYPIQNYNHDLNFPEITALLSKRSNIHTFNLFLISSMNFPFLKRDLVKRGIIQPVILELFLKKSKPNIDKHYLIEITKARNTIKSRNLHGLLIRYGIF